VNKIFHLSTCSTCQRILKECGTAGFEVQDIKISPISATELDFCAKKVGAYEQLFNKRALKYKSLNLKTKVISEPEFRSLILNEYTFLKRPLYIIGNEVFAGNDKKTIQLIKDSLGV